MQSPNPLSDPNSDEVQSAIALLVAQAQEGDERAFSELAALLEERILRHAFFLTRDQQDALDLAQDTWLEAWKCLSRFDGRAQFFTWFCSIMAHRHYDAIRRSCRRVRVLAAAVHAADVNASEPPERLDQEWIWELRDCLERLPPRQRMVIYLRFYANESIEGIAALLSCSPGTVKSRLYYGLERLAKMKAIQSLRNGSGPL